MARTMSMLELYREAFASGVRGQETVRHDLQFGGVSCTKEEDMARPEHALQADLKYQVQRFGHGHQGISAEIDYDLMDLTTAFELIERSSQEWLKLPAVVRDRYRSWANVEAAHKSGELEQVLKAAGVTGVPPGAPAASPSDSAADPPADAGTAS